MGKATNLSIRKDAGVRNESTNEEDQALLSGNVSDEEDIIGHIGQASPHDEAPKTPRSANRVRFQLPTSEETGSSIGPPPSYGEAEDLPTDNIIPLSERRNSWDLDAAEVLRNLSRPKSSLRSAMSNMTNSIIGAGIIGQPYALRQAGCLTGVILLIVLTITVDWTIRLIVINSKLSGRHSFQGTMEHCFGRAGLMAISVAQWAFAFGGMVAFGVIIGDSVPHVLLAVWPDLRNIPVLGLLTYRRTVIFVLIMAISWPLSLYRDIAKLAKASTLALISMIIILVAVVTQGFSVPAESKGEVTISLWTINSGIFQAIGVISFVACLIMALSGFATFGDKTLGNILNNFPTDNAMVNIARFCFGLNMLSTLPLEAFVCREVMFHYWYEGKQVPTVVHAGLSTLLVVSSMLISLMVCDLGAVFELIGATSACALAYILPPLCYLKLSKKSWKTAPAVLCASFGCLVMGISVVQAVLKIIRSKFCRIINGARSSSQAYVV
ncbi:MAG: hypothetical protein M1818_005402 [Claussenomyces sp. TS43310]|nr:MAG: hypothetical protein M1818_005402 [Claussenomyces sp. TS43310]